MSLSGLATQTLRDRQDRLGRRAHSSPAFPMRSVDVRLHPEYHLSTVAKLPAGEIMHRDSPGSEQTILMSVQ